MPDFQLTEVEAASLATLLNKQSTGRIEPPVELAAADAERGKRVFAEKRCAQCHGPADAAAPPIQLVGLPKAGVEVSRGCLADTKAARKTAPEFSFPGGERLALQEFVQATGGIAPSMTPVEHSAYLIERLNCKACHHRDHVVSPRGEIIAEESERGISPAALPNLTFIGEKLHAPWMKRLFHGEQPRKIRPWLSARMPAFPAYADALATGLAAEHGFAAESEPEPSLPIQAELAEIGQKLAEKNQGLDCRQCHAVAGRQPTGDDKTKIAPGIDFAETKQRMRAGFYRRFVLDPPRYDVTIRMPKFAVDGKTTQAAGILEGDAVRQFDALWQFIRSLPEMPSPEQAKD